MKSPGCTCALYSWMGEVKTHFPECKRKIWMEGNWVIPIMDPMKLAGIDTVTVEEPAPIPATVWDNWKLSKDIA